jgi:hypothetical protein
MGLTIAYTLAAARLDSDAALDVVRQLHALAQTLDFDKVGEMFVESEAERVEDDGHGWHPGTRYVGDPLRERHEVIEGEVGEVPIEARIIHADDTGMVDVRPIEAYWFYANVPGSEPAILGLARYPAVVEREIDAVVRPFETGLGEGWHWQHFTKTQYAGLPQYGGPENFLRAHKAVIALLDAAIRLGVNVEVCDDSQYWSHRDDQRMLRTLREWNGLVAAVSGMLKDRIADVQSPIFDHPEFEHLEAEGDAALHPDRRPPQA